MRKHFCFCYILVFLLFKENILIFSESCRHNYVKKQTLSRPPLAVFFFGSIIRFEGNTNFEEDIFIAVTTVQIVALNPIEPNPPAPIFPVNSTEPQNLVRGTFRVTWATLYSAWVAPLGSDRALKINLVPILNKRTQRYKKVFLNLVAQHCTRVGP